jgi:hypothetical protein
MWHQQQHNNKQRLFIFNVLLFKEPRKAQPTFTIADSLNQVATLAA